MCSVKSFVVVLFTCGQSAVCTKAATRVYLVGTQWTSQKFRPSPASTRSGSIEPLENELQRTREECTAFVRSSVSIVTHIAVHDKHVGLTGFTTAPLDVGPVSDPDNMHGHVC